MTDKITLKIAEEMATKRAKILDNFVKTFIASRWIDYFNKQKKLDFRRIKLIEIRESPIKTTFHIELKRGKLPNK